MARQITSSTALVCVFFCCSVSLLVVEVEGFHPDRAIYKWSPLWFNNYIRRGGVLQKRFRDEPLMKWSPVTFGLDSLYNYKRSACAKENAICSFSDETTGERKEIPCCGSLKCLPTGEYYSCSYAGYRNYEDDEPEVYSYE